VLTHLLELQNRIYECAIEDMGIIKLVPRPRTARKDRRKRDVEQTEFDEKGRLRYPLGPGPAPLPFIGLTQTCKKMRKDFRPWWLSQHSVRLSHADSYISCFISDVLKRTKREKREKEGIKHHQRTLRITNLQCDGEASIPSLIKLRIKYPDCSIVVDKGDWPEECITGFLKIINNKNKTWEKWITTGAVKRVDSQYQTDWHTLKPVLRLHVIVKSKIVEQWMKAGPVFHLIPWSDENLKKLGLGDQEYWIDFGFCE
jgi:hypothetical protein